MTRFFSVLILMGLISCHNESKKKEIIIQKEKMTDVMRDVTLAETYVDFFLKKDTSIKKDTLLKREIEKVLSFHNIDVKTFSASYRYYKNNPELFKEIVDSASAWFKKDRTSQLPITQ